MDAPPLESCFGAALLTHPDLAGALPASVKRMLVAIGPEATVTLIVEFGGDRLTLPRVLPNDEGALTATLGREAAVRLIEQFGGQRLEVPVLHGASRLVRDRQIRAEREAGQSFAHIAKRHGITARHVRKIVAVSAPAVAEKLSEAAPLVVERPIAEHFASPGDAAFDRLRALLTLPQP